MRENPETSRAGMRWNDDEDKFLMSNVRRGVDLETIAKHHCRSVKSIRCRLIVKAEELIRGGMAIEEASECVRIPVESILDFRAEQAMKREQQQQQNPYAKNGAQSQYNYQKGIELFTEIRDYLKIIAETMTNEKR